MAILTLTALEFMRVKIGEHEQGGNNRGPLPDLCALVVGLHPEGQFAWCTSLLYLAFRESASQLHLINPFPKTASSQSAARHIEPLCFSQNPTVGAVYILKHTPTTGHAGIVESCANGFVTSEISGNTFAERGGRAGNCVARHQGQPEVTHGGELLGYWNLDLAWQHPTVQVA